MKLIYTNGVFVAESSYEEKDIPKAAGFWWHGGGSWCAQGKCKACNAGFRGQKVWWTFKKESAAHLIEYADAAATAELTTTAEALVASRAVDSDLDIPVPAGLSYYPFQKAGIAYAHARENTLCGDEMGLGKTIQALGLINLDPTIKRVLCVVPASLRLNWLHEAKRWLVRDFNFYVAETGDPIPDDATFVIVNYEKVRPSAKSGEVVYESLFSRTWDLLVVDEVHKLKNSRAQQTKAILGYWDKKKKLQVEGLIYKARKKFFISGTPIMNRPIEIQPLLGALSPKEFGNWLYFAKRYAGAYQNRWGWQVGGATNLPELQDRVRATCMVRRLKKDVRLELPNEVRQIVRLPVNGAGKQVQAELAAYANYELQISALRAEAAARLAAGDAAAYAQAVASLSNVNRAAFTEIAELRHATALAKAPKVIEFVDLALEDNDDHKVVVFAHHKDVIAEFKAHWGASAAVVTGDVKLSDRDAEVKRFQTDPTCRVFVGSIQAASVGFTLTASNHVVFAELDWVPANIAQAEARVARIGQQADSVLFQHLVFDGSLDAKMATELVEKEATIRAAVDTVRNIPSLPTVSEADPAQPKAEVVDNFSITEIPF